MTIINSRTILTENLYHKARSSRSLSPFLGLVTEGGDSLLHLAAAKNDDLFAYKIVKWNPKVDILNEKTQETPLHVAARKGHIQMVRFLWNHGAEINAQNNAMNTPLHCAIWQANEEVIRKLVDFGAELDIVNSSGLTPLQACYEVRFHGRISELLQSKSPTQNLWKHTLSRVIVILSMFPEQNNENTQHRLGIDMPLFEFDGSHAPLIIDAFLSALTEGREDIPLSNVLIKTLESTQKSKNFYQMERYRRDQPILLNAGDEGHLVSILIWGNLIAVCNRDATEAKLIDFYRFNQGKLNLQVLNRLTHTYEDDDAYEAEESKILSELECESLSEAESQCDLPLQTTNNCVFVSLEAAVYAFYRMYALKNKEPIETHNSAFSRFHNKVRNHAVEQTLLHHTLSPEQKTELNKTLAKSQRVQ